MPAVDSCFAGSTGLHRHPQSSQEFVADLSTITLPVIVLSHDKALTHHLFDGDAVKV